jgi:hypothetical protein
MSLVTTSARSTPKRRRGGLDKQAMGQLITYLDKKDNDAAKLEEQLALFELYREAYERPSHAHARDGARSELVSQPKLTRSKGALVASQDTNFSGSGAAEESGRSGQAASKPNSSDSAPQANWFRRRSHVLRPHCQFPERCAGYGKEHCHSCQQVIPIDVEIAKDPRGT